jgi:starch synthase
MNILMVAAGYDEIAPVGGLGEYLSGLGNELTKRGHKVRVAIPNYGFLNCVEGRVDFDGTTAILCGEIPAFPIGNHPEFRDLKSYYQIYGNYEFNRWVDFCKSVFDFICNSEWMPDVIHCHNAQTALLPALMQLTPHARYRDQRPRTVLTIHNMIDLGVGPRSMLDSCHIDSVDLNLYFEYWGGVNCLKAGLMTSDVVTTVSSTYAQEICLSEKFSYGLEGVLVHNLKKPIHGVINGIDEEKWRWNGLEYDGDDDVARILTEKKIVREKIVPMWRSERSDPIVAFKSRWTAQSGIELLGDVLEEALEYCLIIFNAWATPEDIEEEKEHNDLWEQLQALRHKYPTRFLLNPPGTKGPENDAILYQLSDFFLRPAIYEPCGSAQMQCQRYGCIPIVRETGGLADTVRDMSAGDGNGITFKAMTASALLRAIRRASDLYRNPAEMNRLISNGLRQQNGWRYRIDRYISVYEE